MRKLATRFGTALLLAVAACDDNPANPDPPVPASITAFVESENLPLLRNIHLDVAISEHELNLFSAEYGEPQDCPSSCFYSHGFGVAYGAAIGWMGFSASNDVPATPTMYDVQADDVALFDAGVWSRIETQQSWQFWYIFLPHLARDPDTSDDALLRIAARLQTRIETGLAAQLLANPSIATHPDVLQILACLPDAYEVQRQQALDLLGPTFPGCTSP